MRTVDIAEAKRLFPQPTRVSNVGATPSVPAMSHPLQITSRQNLMLIRVEENTVVTLVIETCFNRVAFHSDHVIASDLIPTKSSQEGTLYQVKINVVGKFLAKLDLSEHDVTFTFAFTTLQWMERNVVW